jgi:hypothetical protein
MRAALLLLLLVPQLGEAQEVRTSTLLPAASVAATVGGATGYWIGSQWRFLGSTGNEVHRREAPLLGIVAGSLASAAGACMSASDASVSAKKCLDGAVIGTVPAVAIAGAVSVVLPARWRRWVAPVVYGFIEGGITAWNAARD